MKKNKELEAKVTNLIQENEKNLMSLNSELTKSKRYRRVILKMNGIDKVKQIIAEQVKSKKKKKDSVSKDDTPREKKVAVKCRYEDKGKCRRRKRCKFIHPKRVESILCYCQVIS